MKVYQIVNVTKIDGYNYLIPDSFVFKKKEDAKESIIDRVKIFAEDGEILNYKGQVSSIKEIQDILTKHDFSNEETDCYLYEMEVL